MHNQAETFPVDIISLL